VSRRPIHIIAISTLANRRLAFAVLVTIIVALVIDTSVIRIYNVNFKQLPLEWRTIVFIAISCICVAGLYIILEFTKQQTRELRSLGLVRLRVLAKLVPVSVLLLTLIVGLVIFEIVFTSKYSVLFLKAVTWISYSTAAFSMILLSYTFFAWFNSDRNLVVLLYGLSSAVLAINCGFTIAYANFLLANEPLYVVPHMGAGYPFFSIGWLTGLVEHGYTVSSILSFMLWWAAAVSVLRHYSEKSNQNKKVWILLCIPLTYFLLQFQPLFLNLFSSLLISEPIAFSVIYTITFTLSKPVGGILFAAAFWAIARKLSYNTAVRRYMTISAYGIVLMFFSNQAVLLASAAYPPFGLATILFMGLSSYLVFVGIYSSAISISNDRELRVSIRHLALKDMKLLDSIGTAQVEQEISKRVLTVVKKNQNILTERTGIESSLTDKDMKEYLEEVLQEVSSFRTKSQDK